MVVTYPPDAESRYHPTPAPPGQGSAAGPRYNPLPPTPDTSGQFYLQGVARPRRLLSGRVIAVALGALVLVVVGFVVVVLVG